MGRTFRVSNRSFLLGLLAPLLIFGCDGTKIETPTIKQKTHKSASNSPNKGINEAEEKKRQRHFETDYKIKTKLPGVDTGEQPDSYLILSARFHAKNRHAASRYL